MTTRILRGVVRSNDMIHCTTGRPEIASNTSAVSLPYTGTPLPAVILAQFMDAFFFAVRRRLWSRRTAIVPKSLHYQVAFSDTAAVQRTRSLLCSLSGIATQARPVILTCLRIGNANPLLARKRTAPCPASFPVLETSASWKSLS